MSAKILCSCASVSETEVRVAIKAGAHTLEALKKACEAGAGCQSCHADLRSMLGAHAKEVLAAGVQDGAQLPLFEVPKPGT